MTGADAWLQMLAESIIGREGGIAHRRRSLMSTIALFVYLIFSQVFHVSGIDCLQSRIYNHLEALEDYQLPLSLLSVL